MNRPRDERNMWWCPLGRFFLAFERRRDTGVFKHLKQSRIEFLKAVRSMLDERIERLEKSEEPGPEQKGTRIDVE